MDGNVHIGTVLTVNFAATWMGNVHIGTVLSVNCAATWRGMFI